VLIETLQFNRSFRAMFSERLRARIEQREAVLWLLDRKRAEAGKPDLGSAIEAKILALEMADLDTATAAQEAEEEAASTKVPNTKNSV
jgi:hypothetical protein